MAKILIVDDDPTLLALQAEALAGAGHEVVAATNGKEALHAIEDGSFDLMVTDVIMPEKDGLETIAHLHRTNPALRIIAVSGGGHIEPQHYLEMAKKLGAEQTLTKPYSAELFLQTVEKVLKR